MNNIEQGLRRHITILKNSLKSPKSTYEIFKSLYLEHVNYIFKLSDPCMEYLRKRDTLTTTNLINLNLVFFTAANSIGDDICKEIEEIQEQLQDLNFTLKDDKKNNSIYNITKNLQTMEDFLNYTVEEFEQWKLKDINHVLKLPNRSLNCLSAIDKETVDDLLNLDLDYFYTVEGAGALTLQQVTTIQEQLGKISDLFYEKEYEDLERLYQHILEIEKISETDITSEKFGVIDLKRLEIFTKQSLTYLNKYGIHSIKDLFIYDLNFSKFPRSCSDTLTHINSGYTQLKKICELKNFKLY